MYNKTLINYDLGCIYKLDENQDLMWSPLILGTNQPACDYEYVNHMQLFREDSDILEDVNRSEDQLRALNGLINL